jgi:hypothetical protein
MKVTLGFLKPSSRSFGVELDGSDALLTNEMLLADQPSGRLRSFLNVSFIDDRSVTAAFLDAGGSMVVRTREGAGPRSVAWTAENGRAGLRFSGAKKGAKVEVKMLIEEATWM